MYQVGFKRKSSVWWFVWLNALKLRCQHLCYVFTGGKILVNRTTVWRALLSSFDWPEDSGEGDAEGSQSPSTSTQIQTQAISQGPCVDEWRSLQDYTDSARVFSPSNVTRAPRSLSLSSIRGWIAFQHQGHVLFCCGSDVTGPCDCSVQKWAIVAGEPLFWCTGSR